MAKKKKIEKAKLNLGTWDDYYHKKLMEMDEKALRKEHRRLRDLLIKRYNRINASEFKDSLFARNFRALSNKPQGQLTTKEIAYELSQMASMTVAETGTLSGLKSYRAKQIKSLKEHGVKVAPKDFNKFTEYMEYFRQMDKDQKYGSIRRAELAAEIARRKLDPDEVLEDYDWWVENVEYLQRMRMKNGDGSTRTIHDYQKAISRISDRDYDY